MRDTLACVRDTLVACVRETLACVRDTLACVVRVSTRLAPTAAFAVAGFAVAVFAVMFCSFDRSSRLCTFDRGNGVLSTPFPLSKVHFTA